MEEKILKQFLYHKKLKFNQIEKGIGVRSNKLNYHLQKLVAKGILLKTESTYELSETAEHLIPYLSDKKQALPVLLIHIGNQDEAYLIKRNKRPYKTN
jgi:predicted transcriptional regulator